MTTTNSDPSIEKLKQEREAIAALLQAKDEEINQQTQARRAQKIQEIKAVIKEYGLSQSELFGDKASELEQNKATPKKRIKYSVPRYLNSKGEEWIGTGTHPQWLVTALAGGKSKEEFVNPEWTRIYGSLAKGKKKTVQPVAPSVTAA